MLDIQDISKRFGQGDSAVTALHQVSFSIAEGEFFTLLGPSGCGKTTLLRMIAGFEPPSGGALVLEGRDMSAIAQLAGKLNTLTVARVGYGLSREAREKVETDASAQAIAKFRARAADYAKQFGFSGFTLREVSVSGGEQFAPVPMLRARAMSAASSDEALPVEAGKATVTVAVNGSIQLTK